MVQRRLVCCVVKLMEKEFARMWSCGGTPPIMEGLLVSFEFTWSKWTVLLTANHGSASWWLPGSHLGPRTTCVRIEERCSKGAGCLWVVVKIMVPFWVP